MAARAYGIHFFPEAVPVGEGPSLPNGQQGVTMQKALDAAMHRACDRVCDRKRTVKGGHARRHPLCTARLSEARIAFSDQLAPTVFKVRCRRAASQGEALHASESVAPPGWWDVAHREYL